MAAALSLIPNSMTSSRMAPRRSGQSGRADLQPFSAGRGAFETRHVALFDDILVGLVPATEVATLRNSQSAVETRERAADAGEAARGETEIRIAGPISRSPLLDDPTLVDIARGRGQEHLAAISGRATLSPSVTDVIVRRGDRDVVRNVAANAGAQFSEYGYQTHNARPMTACWR
jgi:uncharacterized protein (DUF2336 family)